MKGNANNDQRVVHAVLASVAVHISGIAYLSFSAHAEETVAKPLAVRLVTAAQSAPVQDAIAAQPEPRRAQSAPTRPVIAAANPVPVGAPTVPAEAPRQETVVAAAIPSSSGPSSDAARSLRETASSGFAQVAEIAPTPVTTAPLFGADYLQNPAPAYPSGSRRIGEQGTVLLRVLVNAAGAAENVLVKESSGFSRLDESALETVRRWRFVPARRGPDPIAAWVIVPVSFRMGRT